MRPTTPLLRRALLGALLVALHQAAARPAHAQSRALPPNRIIGVFDAQSGEPLEGVVILDIQAGTYVTTITTGTASLAFVAFHADTASIEIRKLGFRTGRLLVSRSDTASVTVVLDRVTRLPTVVTHETYRIDEDAGARDGFAQRCQSKSVTCFTPEYLKAHPGDGNIADLLIKADGVMVGSCTQLLTISMGKGVVESGANARSSQCGNAAMHPTAGPGYCQPTFFVDGSKWDSHLGRPIDMQPGHTSAAPYTTANVKAIEVYSSERMRPLRFEGDYGCGAVVLWTR